ncbi:hypothetical protein, partial [Shewanella chilikensis]|uniref:hypothetical protein n=1 Tax=Shewanella chilikensis TaxID=558541 RepID=UPI00399BD53B
GLRKWTRLEEFPKHLIEVFENSILYSSIPTHKSGLDVYYQLSKLLKSNLHGRRECRKLYGTISTGLKKAKDKY